MKLIHSSYLTLITVWYFLGVLQLAIFLYDFFPVKSKTPHDVLQPPIKIKHIRLDANQNYPPEVNKVVIIVIDAMRRDFVTESNMPYMYSKIMSDEACLLTARAESPTVTLPRIKAMTTGSVPEFIDLALNFASTEIKQDSILQRAKEAGKKMIFYGDNTWLKLFPNIFVRSEGTHSFYVSDFYEVDNNVTRHLSKELVPKKDWDVMILHYLGVDHVGHMYGPFSKLIKKKMNEMDSIIKRVHSNILQHDNKTLLMICGDHGIRDSGGHGGSSEPEMLVPLIFTGINCKSNDKTIIAQTDIAPTLSVLMGLPIPADSIGRVIPEITLSFPILRRLYILYYNALNLIEKNRETYYPEFKDVIDEHAEYITNKKHYSANIISAYEQKIFDVSEDLIRTSIHQHVPFLCLAWSATTLVFLALLMPKYSQYYWFPLYCVTLVFVLFMYSNRDSYVMSLVANFYCIIPLSIFIYLLPDIFFIFQKFTSSSLLIYLTAATGIRSAILLSTSYIDEEHHIWFYLWGTLVVFGIYEELKTSQSWKNILLWFLLFVGLRFCRHLNHVGTWASVPDIADWLQLEHNVTWLTLAIVMGLVGVVYSSRKIFPHDKLITLMTVLTVLAIFGYRIALRYQNQTVLLARVAMILTIVTSIVSYKKRDILKTLVLAWMLYLALLMRPYNIILIPVCVGASNILFKLTTCMNSLTILHIWLGQILFHCQGFYNSLASVDVSPGYVGLTEYSLFLTSFQVVCHVYTFQILSLLLLFSNYKYKEHVKMLHTIVIYRLSSVIYFCFVILIHRQHLFIWSVFSPKLLIESCHSLCLLIGILFYCVISRTFVRKQTINIP